MSHDAENDVPHGEHVGGCNSGCDGGDHLLLGEGPEGGRILRVLRRMADHDANEERRYLIEGKRFFLTWSWVWLSPTLGVGADYDPYAGPTWNGDEVASVWAHLGPLTIEAYWTRVIPPGSGDVS